MRPLSWFHRRGAFTPVALGAAAVVALAAAAFFDVYAACAAAAVGAAVATAWTWRAGWRVWPARETVADPRIGASPADVESRLAAASGPIRIGVVGDVQNGLPELVDVLRETRRRGCCLLLFVGDCVNVGRPARYAILRAFLRDHAAALPILAVPGNHDVGADGSTATWTEWVGPTHWRIDVRGFRVLGLDDAAGPLSPASMELLRESAKTPPARGTILVAHRQLFARADEKRPVVRARVRQIASAGIAPAPALTVSGHGGANEEFVDAAGTRHFVQGENCDRATKAESPRVGAATLTLGDGPPVYEPWTIPRRARLRDELRRLAVGSVYPALRPRG